MKTEHQKNNLFKLFYKCRNLAALPLTFATATATSLPAQAMSFNFSYQPGTVTKQQIEGVELAGNIWSSYLQDSDVEINVHFEMTSGVLPSGKLGGATPYIVKMNYDKYKEGLTADGTANINLLPTSNQGSDKYSVRLQNGSINGSYYEIMQTTANNKALGNDISGDASGLDLYIQLDNSVDWSYDYVNGNTPSNKYDFVSVVLHEIGHGLGFISGVDAQTSQLALPTALDMFRYSSQSASQNAIDYAVGGTKYFSTDGGQSQTGEFSTGVNTILGGDGDQASHWENNAQPYLGIMSSTIQKGETRQISALDLTAFDYIGWDVNHGAQLNLSALQQNAATKANNIWGNSNYILDRSSDVQSMINDSGIYNSSIYNWLQSIINNTSVYNTSNNNNNGNNNNGNSNSNSGNLPWPWGGFWQQGESSNQPQTLPEDSIEENHIQPQAIPEGSTNTGILATILLAAFSVTKRFHCRRIRL